MKNEQEKSPLFSGRVYNCYDLLFLLIIDFSFIIKGINKRRPTPIDTILVPENIIRNAPINPKKSGISFSFSAKLLNNNTLHKTNVK